MAPQIKEHRLAKETPAASSPTPDARRIVDIVDDDESVRRALQRLFNSVGVQSRVFDSARSYLESGLPASSDCLLLDLHLPEMSGIELLEHLREAAPDLQVICMTGRDEPEFEQRLAATGVRQCLRKPFDQSDLFAALSLVIADPDFS